jgi:hypothetical protein
MGAAPAASCAPIVTVTPIPVGAPAPLPPHFAPPPGQGGMPPQAMAAAAPISTGLRSLRKKVNPQVSAVRPTLLLPELISAEEDKQRRLRKFDLTELKQRETKLRKELAREVNALQRFGHFYWNKLDHTVSSLRATLVAQHLQQLKLGVGAQAVELPRRMQQFRDGANNQPEKVWREAWLLHVRAWLEARARMGA